jgi:hypothetical protein
MQNASAAAAKLHLYGTLDVLHWFVVLDVTV